MPRAGRCRVPRDPLRRPGLRAVEPPHRRAVLARARPRQRCSTPSSVEQTTLVGCSMGGAIAIDFALEHPDRVVRARGGGVGPRRLRGARGRGGLVGGVEGAGRGGGRGRRPGARRGPATGDLGAARARTTRPARRIREIAFDNIHELTMDESGEEELDPPAAAAARRDRRADAGDDRRARSAVHAARTGDLIAARCPRTRSGWTIEGADHVVNLRRPLEFDGALLAFLDGLV